MTMRSRVERIVERYIFNSRWLLTPFYLGLVLVVAALGITFFRELWHLYAMVFTAGEAEVVLLVLSLFASTLTLAAGRSTVLQGGVHLVIFAAFLVMSAVP